MGSQVLLTKNAENDVRLMYKKHKKELQVCLRRVRSIWLARGREK